MGEMPGRGAWPNNWLFSPDDNIYAWAFDTASPGAAAGTDWFSQPFKWAAAARDAAGFTREQVPLLYNDYGIETGTDKANAVLRFLSEQLAAGAPIDGVGLQAHMQC